MGQETMSHNFDDMTIEEIGDKLNRRLRAIREEHGQTPPEVEVRKKWIIVTSKRDGHRVKLTMAEAVRFLGVTAEVAPGMGDAVHGAEINDSLETFRAEKPQ
jgi:hypothetical protein